MNSVLCQHIYNMAKIAKYRLSIICFFIIKQLKIILFVLIFQIFNCCCVVICFHDAWKYFQEVGVVKWLLLHWLMKFHFRSKVSTLWAIMWGFLNTMKIFKIEWVFKWLFFKTKWAICHLYHSKDKLQLDEMVILISALN